MYYPIKMKQTCMRMCVNCHVCVYKLMEVSLMYPSYKNQLLWLLMIHRQFSINQSKTSTRVCTYVHAHPCWHFLVYKSIDIHIIYLCCEYELIWTYNDWFIGVSVLLANSNSSACACVCSLAFFGVPISRCLYNLPMLWISTHLNLLWMIYRPFSISKSNSSTRTCACRWTILTT
jgi:hypothetical protein